MNALRSPAPGANLLNFGGNNKNSAVMKAANSVVQAANSAMNTAKNTASNVMSGKPTGSQITLIIMFVIIVTLAGVFYQQIADGFSSMYQFARRYFGGAVEEPAPKPTDDVLEKPEAPQDNTVQETNLVEKILPGNKQVFNISKNAYTYYDAEPLCKALGSELATYEQVKQAYARGADWCNYGWVKGQMAVFPTQTNTWEQIQNGPEEQRNACGRPGVNGGFFDNPELRFGVNCYGVKPEQKDHDATNVASGDAAPLSPGGLEFESARWLAIVERPIQSLFCLTARTLGPPKHFGKTTTYKCESYTHI